MMWGKSRLKIPGSITPIIINKAKLKQTQEKVTDAQEATNPEESKPELNADLIVDTKKQVQFAEVK
jgi:hypothetical protein